MLRMHPTPQTAEKSIHIPAAGRWRFVVPLRILHNNSTLPVFPWPLPTDNLPLKKNPI